MYIVLLMCLVRLNSHVADLWCGVQRANMQQITVRYTRMGLWKPHWNVAEKMCWLILEYLNLLRVNYVANFLWIFTADTQHEPWKNPQVHTTILFSVCLFRSRRKRKEMDPIHSYGVFLAFSLHHFQQVSVFLMKTWTEEAVLLLASKKNPKMDT